MKKSSLFFLAFLCSYIFQAYAAKYQMDIDDLRFVLDSSTKKASVFKFIGPTSRKTVTIPDNIMNADDGITYTVTEIADVAFYQSNVVTVNFPSTIKTIGSCAFQDCPRLFKGKPLVLPPNVTKIGMEAFKGCHFTEVAISESVSEIGESAFASTDLKKVSFELPKTSLIIGSFAFRNCKSLTSVALPSRLTKLGQAAFGGCTALTKASFPGTLPKIPGICFEDCTALTSVIIPEGVTTIDWGAFQRSGITSLNLPSTLKTINQQAFSGCSRLASIAIPQGVNAISWMCFSGCSALKSVVIPASVTTIESGAFYQCTLLSNITCNAVTPPDVADESCFSTQSYDTATLNIPASSKAAYSSAHVWEKFKWFTFSSVSAPVADEEETIAEYFTIDGIKVAPESLTPGIYIRRTGSKTSRILIR